MQSNCLFVLTIACDFILLCLRCLFIHIVKKYTFNYPQTTTVGWVAWMSCSQPDAWCHRMKLKSKGCEQVAVLLVIIISFRSLKNKIRFLG